MMIRVCLLVLYLLAPLVHGAAEPAGRSNIIFVLADDLGWSGLGCYDNQFNEKPNLDRLAREGIRFTQA